MANPYKLHPLHTVEMVVNHLRQTGKYLGDRHTGRSTAQALRLIANAIENPEKLLIIEDHHGTTNADYSLQHTVQKMIDLLEFKHFTVQNKTIVFETK